MRWTLIPNLPSSDAGEACSVVRNAANSLSFILEVKPVHKIHIVNRSVRNNTKKKDFRMTNVR